MNDTAGRLGEVFRLAQRLPAGPERMQFLRNACTDDAALLGQVEALLNAETGAASVCPDHGAVSGHTQSAANAPDCIAPVAGTGSSGPVDPGAATKAAPPVPFDDTGGPAEEPGPADGTLERAGDRVCSYRLLHMLGEGGFGVVWKAEQEAPVRRQVALKIIKLGMDTREVVARFAQERQALAIMDHPGIARVYDAGATPSGRPFFVMELVQGIPITRYCDDRQLSLHERIALAIQVCAAIQHAHQRGVIHRDIKPSNILVAEVDGLPMPKVIDFGIAKAAQGPLTDLTLVTHARLMLGTPLYMSPEQARLTETDVDTRTDIYSLGVLLYELLTGRTPIDRADLQAAGLDAVCRLIREVDPPRPSTLVSTRARQAGIAPAGWCGMRPDELARQLRRDLDWIVMKCLEKQPARRYDTVGSLARDLERSLRREPVSARPPTAAYVVGRFCQRHRTTVTAAAAITVSVLLGLAFSIWKTVEAGRARRSEERLRVTAQQDRDAAVREARRAEAAEKQAASERDTARRRMLLEQGRYLMRRGFLNPAYQRLSEAWQMRPSIHTANLLHELSQQARSSWDLCQTLPVAGRPAWAAIAGRRHELLLYVEPRTNDLALVCHDLDAGVERGRHRLDGLRALPECLGSDAIAVARSTNALTVLSLPSLHVTAQVPLSETVYELKASGDGSRLAIAGRDGTFRVIDAATLQPVFVTNIPVSATAIHRALRPTVSFSGENPPRYLLVDPGFWNARKLHVDLNSQQAEWFDMAENRTQLLDENHAIGLGYGVLGPGTGSVSCYELGRPGGAAQPIVATRVGRMEWRDLESDKQSQTRCEPVLRRVRWADRTLWLPERVHEMTAASLNTLSIASRPTEPDVLPDHLARSLIVRSDSLLPHRREDFRFLHLSRDGRLLVSASDQTLAVFGVVDGSADAAHTRVELETSFWSADVAGSCVGTVMTVTSNAASLSLLDEQTGEMSTTVLPMPRPTSPDHVLRPWGLSLATGLAACAVLFQEVQAGPDVDTAAARFGNRILVVYELDRTTNRLLAIKRAEFPLPFGQEPNARRNRSIKLSSDGRLVAIYNTQEGLQVLRVSDGHALHRRNHRGTLAFSTDGERAFAIVGTAGDAVEAWQMETGAVLWQGVAPRGSARIALTRDGRGLYVGGSQGIVLLAVSNGVAIRHMALPAAPVAVSAAGDEMVGLVVDSASSGVMNLYDMETGEVLEEIAASSHLLDLCDFLDGDSSLVRAESRTKLVVQRGCTPAQVEALLDRAGYPRAGALTDRSAAGSRVDGVVERAEYAGGRLVLSGAGSSFGGELAASRLFLDSDPTNLYLCLHDFLLGTGGGPRGDLITIHLGTATGMLRSTAGPLSPRTSEDTFARHMLRPGAADGGVEFPFGLCASVGICSTGVVAFTVRSADGGVVAERMEHVHWVGGIGFGRRATVEIAIPRAALSIDRTDAIELCALLGNGNHYLSNETIPAGQAGFNERSSTELSRGVVRLRRAAAIIPFVGPSVAPRTNPAAGRP